MAEQKKIDRNKTIAHTFLPSFDDANSCLCQKFCFHGNLTSHFSSLFFYAYNEQETTSKRKTSSRGTNWRLPLPMNVNLRTRLNVELCMRRTKLSELSSWKVSRLAQLSSSEWVWIVQHVLSVYFRRTERLKIVSGTNVDLQMWRTKLIN